ncbi:adenosylcobinamide-GDP ribazoletransferase [Solimicrobium silvestre]|uniref:Adenosylcobinamide-GDP ribazoletransferase n=1 Tax=Solimicrobium silvestre TaxID=2099400 RepID=A0A2S9GUW9_9BURK|nr:adenosylcobinamide-GDP ribazoletransferase [Solimicrobium silvestre]PRC91525.1 cobS: cobalamin 5'-phosphate synthase [Solimicrobium silvestre]
MSFFTKAGAWSLQQVRLFFIALQFFTRIQIPQWVGFEADWLHHAARYFVLVGLVVASVASAVYVCAALFLPHLVAVLLSTIASIYLTGAFHEDGFADVCDGFGGASSKERVLEIMKDSRIGAYGAIGIILMLALKCSVLFYLPAPALIATLFIGHALSRLAATTLIWRLSYVRAEGKAKPLAERISTGEYITAMLTALLPMMICGVTGWLSWFSMLIGVVAVALAGLWLSALFVRRIGGYTGDCLGAVQQFSEVAFYLAILATLRTSFYP